MNVTFRLMQEGGVSGPVETVEVPEDRAGIDNAATAWAGGQIGHPWDILTVETEDGECWEVEL